jgi:tRNA (mo5U34)-methyltransferase
VELERSEAKLAVSKLEWWHTIDLGNGIVTPGKINPADTLCRIGMPEDLSGKTVLDIGAADGFYSFEAERRGASRVVATGLWGKGGYKSKDAFDLARNLLHSKVESVEIDLFDMSPEKMGAFDVVLMLGVLYHLQHPLLGLQRVCRMTKEMMVLETHVDLLEIDEPVIRFYPGTELDGDSTNWCGPNLAAVESMLKVAGFTKVATITAPDRRDPALGRFKGAVATLLHGPAAVEHQRGRAAFHAWR